MEKAVLVILMCWANGGDLECRSKHYIFASLEHCRQMLSAEENAAILANLERPLAFGGKCYPLNMRVFEKEH